MQTKWNIGGCGTECGSSGVTVECPCEQFCDVGTVMNAYGCFDIAYYESTNDAGCCVFRSNPFVTAICKGYGPHYEVITICGDHATVQIFQASDDELVLQFGLVHSEAPTRNCFGKDSLGNTAYHWDGGTVISDCGYDASAASMSNASDIPADCTSTPWVIPVGSDNCCPCEPCGISYDPINRLDSADPGDLWTEVSGDWYVESAGLRSDDADAIILANASAPGGVELRTVIVPVAGNAGDYNLILGYTDSDNYFRVCWTYGGTESAASDTLKLYQMEAGVETELTLTSELAQDEYDGGPGWLLIGCINATRTHLTGYVRSTNDVPVLLSSAQISAADVGDQAGLGEITAASGGYRSPTINTVSTDCQTCPSYVTCTHVGGFSPCANSLAPRDWLVTLPGGWVQPAPIGGFTGNACCPQWSSTSVVAEWQDSIMPLDYGLATDPTARWYCLWLYEVRMQIPPDTADEMGCTSFPVKRFFVILIPEPAGGTQFRWHAYARMQNANNVYTDLAEWLSDPYEIGEFDCQSAFSIPVRTILDEHPGDMANWAGQSYCDGAMGSPLLVEPV